MDQSLCQIFCQIVKEGFALQAVTTDITKYLFFVVVFCEKRRCNEQQEASNSVSRFCFCIFNKDCVTSLSLKTAALHSF